LERLNTRLPAGFFVAAFAFARLIMLATMSPENLRGYGDFISYFELAGLPGLPFIDYWVEYPPVFPFLAEIIHCISGGREHIFIYLMISVLSLADAGSLYIFSRLSGRWFSPEKHLLRTGAYLLILISLPYNWWYLEPLVVFWMMLGISLIFDRRWLKTGLAIAVGVGIKFFPILVVLAAWRRAPWQKLILLAVTGLAPVLLLFGVLWLNAPEFTSASLLSQASKGSWETVWALVDGNLHTGTFGPFDERLDPETAVMPRGNPPVIPPLVSLLVFGCAGLVFLFYARPVDERQAVAVVGFAWCLMLLWSPGWSPQWILYLLPLILLSLAGRQALLLGAAFILTALLEWPVLLSRGYFSLISVPIVLRTFLLVVAAASFAGSVLLRRNGIMPDRKR